MKVLNFVLFICLIVSLPTHAGTVYPKKDGSVLSDSVSETKKSIAKVYSNAPLEVLEKNGDYYKVKLTGWIKNSSLASDRLAVDNSYLDIESFIKENRPTGNTFDVATSRYFKLISFVFKVKNKTDKTIRYWEGVITVKDKEGKELLSMNMKSDESNLAPGAIQNLTAILEEKDFKYTAEFEKIYSMNINDFDIKLSDILIEYAP